MSHRRMNLALSLVFILCGLFNSIFCEKQQHSQKHMNLVLLKKISALSQKMEAHPKDFAQELFKALIIEDPRKNIIFSPMAMTTTLATLSLGIKSTMRTHHPEDLKLEPKLLDVHKYLQPLVHVGRELVKQKLLKHQHILFINRKMMVDQMLLQQISKLQGMDIQMIDFTDTEKAKKTISHHVAEKTHMKITDLITDLNPETILCLVNHIFFKGILKRAFQPKLTQKEDFFVNDQTKVQVDMMRKTERMLYSRSEELHATMIKMPCKGNVSLTLMLPDAGQFDTDLKKMTAKRAKLQKISDFRLVRLILPKLKISFKINFKHLLPKIHPKHILTTTAISQAITSKAPLPNLEALHQAEIELSEHALTVDTAIHTDNLLKVPMKAKEVPVVVKVPMKAKEVPVVVKVPMKAKEVPAVVKGPMKAKEVPAVVKVPMKAKEVPAVVKVPVNTKEVPVVVKVPMNTKEVPVVVKVNRPFLLFVEDEKTQRDLFVGKVLNPQVE